MKKYDDGVREDDLHSLLHSYLKLIRECDDKGIKYYEVIADKDGLKMEMSILKEIVKSVTGNCKSCINYTDDGNDGECYIYHTPNHGVSKCDDWRIRE